MAIADVTIMGAGAFGLSIACACALRGAKVQVIDPHGVAAGSSGGIVGALAPHVPENWNDKKAFQFDSLIMADPFWAKIESISGQNPGYARSGRIQPIADERGIELAQARAKTAVALWQGKATWQIAQSHGDWTPQSPTGLVIKDTLSARIHPRDATHALAKALRVLGGTITPDGPHQGKIVWATGWQGMLDLSRQMGRNVGNGVKGQAALLKFDAADQPQLFADRLHIIPHHDGTVAIGSTSERDFDDPTQTDAQLDDVITRAIAAFPVLRDAPVIERWAGVRPRAKSRAPMLGMHPLRPDDFIANGGFKIGFGMAPKVGQVMADLVLENKDAIPEGFKPAASL
ncbi:NAD(P)/FAD-dependent oxidoreductase [Aestuariibius sp. HNIBRBA575]|uniref:NAD(P)/FAD-dependent oxidoreductase n=1 Tax=Aestuariibius sp. HNIBRBA575 TaxID=3233343 RepID=UPI0034A24A38